MSDNKNDPDLSEWVVGIKWDKTFDHEQAKRFQGILENQNIVCLLRTRLQPISSERSLAFLAKCAPAGD